MRQSEDNPGADKGTSQLYGVRPKCLNGGRSNGQGNRNTKPIGLQTSSPGGQSSANSVPISCQSEVNPNTIRRPHRITPLPIHRQSSVDLPIQYKSVKPIPGLHQSHNPAPIYQSKADPRPAHQSGNPTQSPIPTIQCQSSNNLPFRQSNANANTSQSRNVNSPTTIVKTRLSSLGRPSPRIDTDHANHAPIGGQSRSR